MFNENLSGLSSVDRKAISDSLGIFKPEDIENVKGTKYASIDNVYEIHNYEVSLKNKIAYSIRLIRYLKVQGQPFQVIRLIHTKSNFKGKLVFIEEPTTSVDQLNFVSSLKLPIGKIAADSFKVQYNSSDKNIIRATCLTLLKDYPERFEIIYDRKQKSILSFRFMD